MASLRDKASSIYIAAATNITEVANRIGGELARINQRAKAATNDMSKGFGSLDSKVAMLSKRFGSLSGSVSKSGGSITRSMLGAAASVGGVYVAVNGLKSLFQKGFEVTINTEAAKNGISGLIATMYDIRDLNGELVEGPKKFAAATAIADKQIKKIMADARNGAASFDQILQAYQQGIGPGAAAGMSPERVQQLSNLVAQTAVAQNMADGQAAQELRALLSGKIDRSAQIGNTLQFGAQASNQKEYQEKLKAGGDEFADYLIDKMKYMQIAGEATAKTIGGTFATIKMNYEQFAKATIPQMTKSFETLMSITNKMFDGDTGNLTDKYQPLADLLDTIGGVIGDSATSVFDYLLDKSQEIGNYFADNPWDFEQLVEVGAKMFDTLKKIGSTVLDIGINFAKVFLDATGTGEQINGMMDGLNTFEKVMLSVKLSFIAIDGIVQGIAKVINDVVDALRAFFGVALNALLKPLTVAIIGLGQAIDKIPGSGNTGKKIQNLGKNLDLGLNLASVQIAGENNSLLGVTSDDVKKQGGFFSSLGREVAGKNRDESIKTLVKDYTKIVDTTVDGMDEALNDALEKAKKNKELQAAKIYEAFADDETKISNIFNNLSDVEDGIASIYAKAAKETKIGTSIFDRVAVTKAKDESAKKAEQYTLSNPNADKKDVEDEKTKNKRLREEARLKREQDRLRREAERSADKAYKNDLKNLDINLDAQKSMYEDQSRWLELNYSKNSVNIKDYYDNNNQIAKKSQDSELAYIDETLKKVQERMTAVKGNKDAENEINELKNKELELTTKRNNLEKDFSFLLAQNEQKRKDALKDYSRGIEDLSAKIKTLQGDATFSPQLNLDREIEDLKERYKSDPSVKNQIDEYERLSQQRVNYNSIMDKYNNILASQQLQEDKLNYSVDMGRTSQLDSLKELGELRQKDLPELEKYREQLDLIMNNSTDPVLIQQIKQVGFELDKTKDKLKPLAAQFDTLMKNGLVDSMTEFMTGTKNAKDAFKDFAGSIATEMTKLVNNKIVTQLFNMVTEKGSSTSMFGDFFAGIFGQRAAGGSVGNRPTLVGENGPELFLPGGSGYIMNSPKTAQLGNNGGGNNIIQNINIVTRDKQSFTYSATQSMEMITKQLRKGTRNS